MIIFYTVVSAYKDHLWFCLFGLYNQLRFHSIVINEAELNVLHIFELGFTIICHIYQQNFIIDGPYKRNTQYK